MGNLFTLNQSFCDNQDSDLLKIHLVNHYIQYFFPCSGRYVLNDKVLGSSHRFHRPCFRPRFLARVHLQRLSYN